jgi:hypothetical protein
MLVSPTNKYLDGRAMVRASDCSGAYEVFRAYCAIYIGIEYTNLQLFLFSVLRQPDPLNPFHSPSGLCFTPIRLASERLAMSFGQNCAAN